MRFLPFTNLYWMLSNVLEVLMLLLIIEVIVSWAMAFGARGVTPSHPWVRTLRQINEPILAPFRRLAPPHKLRGLDISPLLAIFLIQFLQGFLYRAGASSLMR